MDTLPLVSKQSSNVRYQRRTSLGSHARVAESSLIASFPKEELDSDVIVGFRRDGILGSKVGDGGKWMEFSDRGVGMMDVEMGEWASAGAAAEPATR